MVTHLCGRSNRNAVELVHDFGGIALPRNTPVEELILDWPKSSQAH